MHAYYHIDHFFFLTNTDFTLSMFYLEHGSKVLIYFGEIVPIAFLLVLNCLIIYKSTRFSNKVTSLSGNSAKRKAEMTRTILLMAFIYIALVLPTTICSNYFYNNIVALDAGTIILGILTFIQFSYPAFNFFILFYNNKLFAQEAKSILLCRIRQVHWSSSVSASDGTSSRL